MDPCRRIDSVNMSAEGLFDIQHTHTHARERTCTTCAQLGASRLGDGEGLKEKGIQSQPAAQGFVGKYAEAQRSPC